jgi:hypothetical protein
MFSLMEDTTIKDILKTVESAYQQGDFQGAISTLEKNQIHVTPGLWHYNMGTLYAKLENFPLARYHFLMSDMEGYTNKDLIKNKKIVEEKLDIPKHEKMLSTSDYFIRGSVEATHGIFTMVCLLIIICGVFLSFRRSNFKAFRFSLVLSCLVLVINFWVQNWKKFIVLEGQVLHEGPSSIFLSNQEVPPGTMIVVLEKDDWLRVLYPSQYGGWIKHNGIRKLK